jgi:hypothetical protein
VVKHVIGNPQSLRSSMRTDYTASEAASEGSEDERSPRGDTGSRQQKSRDTSDGSGSDGSASDDDESTHMGSDISVHDDVASEERSEEVSEPEVYSKPSSRRASNANSDKARGKEEGCAWSAANVPKPTGVKTSKPAEVRRNPAESDEERSPTVQEKGVDGKRKEVVLTADRELVVESEEVHVVQLIPSRKVQEPVQTVKIGAAFSDGNRVSESRRALSPLRPGGSKGSNVAGSGGRLRGEGAGFR